LAILAAAAMLAGASVAPAAESKPNILVIFGDDIGITNLSCYSDGLMGYETPNMIASPRKVCASSTITANNRARQDALRSSQASTVFAPG
jgi:hypothetical protein